MNVLVSSPKLNCRLYTLQIYTSSRGPAKTNINIGQVRAKDMSASQAVIVNKDTARFSHLPRLGICPLLLTPIAAGRLVVTRRPIASVDHLNSTMLSGQHLQ